MSKNTLAGYWVAILLFSLLGCASEVVRTPVSFVPTNSQAHEKIVLAKDVKVSVSAWYSRVLPNGSIWELKGSLPQGNVYRRVKDIFTVEGAQVHEAYLVIAGEHLVGFYLPVEQAYSPTDPVLLIIKKG